MFAGSALGKKGDGHTVMREQMYNRVCVCAVLQHHLGMYNTCVHVFQEYMQIKLGLKLLRCC